MENSVTSQLTLKSIRREHDVSLNFCYRVRTGLTNQVKPERIRKYTDWFSNHYLEPHFEMEEKVIFPVLGSNARVKRALANHRRIRRLLSCGCENEKVLNLLEEELAAFIRFEEKVLYREIEKATSPRQQADFERQHECLHGAEEQWEDKFWLE